MWVVAVCFEIVLIFVQERCTVYAKCTTGMEIVLGAAGGSSSDMGQMEARFSLFGDSVILDAR
jgi:hypothetical protein